MISVIVPIYNVEKYLRKCIDSILDQTFQDIELILVDDGSSDNCSSICDEYKNLDHRIKIIHKENGGLVSAWKAGLAIASGEYVGFVDSDDYISKDMYENLYETITNDNSDLAICNVYNDNKGKITVQDSFLEAGLYNGDKLKELKQLLMPSENHEGRILKFYRWNKLYVKTKLDKIIEFVDDRVSCWEDMITTFPYLLMCDSISIINKPCYYYVQRDSSIIHSHDINKQLSSYLLSIDIAALEASELGYSDQYNFDYLRQDVLLSLIDCQDKYKICKKNYIMLYNEVISRKVSFNSPYISKANRLKAFLLKHKAYLILYVLLKIKSFKRRGI